MLFDRLPTLFGAAMRTFALIAAVTALLAGALNPAQAAPPFPSRQITIVVPFAAGGPSDAMARLIAQGLSEKIGARVIVENIAGAGGTVGSARVPRAEAARHPLLVGNIGPPAAHVCPYPHLPHHPPLD